MNAVPNTSPPVGGKNFSTSGSTLAVMLLIPPALSTAITASVTAPTMAMMNWKKSVVTTPQYPDMMEYAMVTALAT